MDLEHSVAGHRQVSTAVFGMIVLTLGMGIGRFLYTPMLPVMLHEGIFTFSQLSLIASANYAGYLVGSLLFSFGIFNGANHLRGMLLAAALATGILIYFMAIVTSPEIVLCIRFMAGVASAGMMIFGSMLILQHTHNPFVIASLFAGVGAGIFIGNEYVIAGVAYAANSKFLWSGAAFISAMLFVVLIILLPKNKNIIAPEKMIATSVPDIQWWNLALLYGLAGFGYIIVATYLPLMAQGMGNDFLANHIWSIVGLAVIPGCYGWLWAARQWNILPCLTVNLIMQASCVVLASFINSPWLLTLSCIGFGATFMGTSSLVMPLAKKIKAPGKINMLGLVTLTYGIGQVAGPLMVSALQASKNGMTLSILLGAGSLFAAAGISYFQHEKVKCLDSFSKK
ncbi:MULTISPECIES: MFS transporter [unclassified Citrobacter]|uniref:MFS transporter n=1 Tax=unclassified Citrobacter TaxID=2644389 RepID=UPI0005EEF5FD|nr:MULTISPECIES: MFS transporter [unclassified Citrobacter]MDM2942021.1 MFS transporter [Citrobacter sp. Cm038]